MNAVTGLRAKEQHRCQHLLKSTFIEPWSQMEGGRGRGRGRGFKRPTRCNGVMDHVSLHTQHSITPKESCNCPSLKTVASRDHSLQDIHDLNA